MTTEETLRGNRNGGTPTTIAGELRLPLSQVGRMPAIIIMHTSAGINAATTRWAQEFNDHGIASFVLDSFSGRGISNTLSDQSKLSYFVEIVDAYAALSVLAKDDRIDPKRIAIIGFSRGGFAAIYTSLNRFRKAFAPAGIAFAAHIGVFAPCYTTLRDETDVTRVPIRFFHGLDDDYDPAEACKNYSERLTAAGADVSFKGFPGVSHSYDSFYLQQLVVVKGGQTMRHCALSENSKRQIIDTKSGIVFNYNNPCVEYDPHIAYNESAYKETLADILRDLDSAFLTNGNR